MNYAQFDQLFLALQRLDKLLERAIAAAQVSYGPEAAADPYRGLHINKDEVARLLTRKPGESPLQVEQEGSQKFPAEQTTNSSALAWLQQAFDLSAFELDLVLIALAPEIDLKYERLYAYLQDDVTRRRASVDLALNLLCSSASEKLWRRRHLTPCSPLLQHNLLQLVSDPHQIQPPLLSYYLKLDDQIVRILLGQNNLEPRLASFCQLFEPGINLAQLPLNEVIKQGLLRIVTQALKTTQPLRLYFWGPQGVDKQRTAIALAGELKTSLLMADLAFALKLEVDFEPVLQLLFREARLKKALLYLEGIDTIKSNQQGIAYQHLLARLAQEPGVLILSGLQPWIPTQGDAHGAIAIPFSLPDFTERQAYWREQLAAAQISLDERSLNTLVAQFRLSYTQIADVITTASNQALWNNVVSEQQLSHPHPRVNLEELFAAARVQSGHDLTALARKIEPKYGWDDIVLPHDRLTQLEEICHQARYWHLVYEKWGFERKLSLGKGLNALFSGPPGTGKTMAAEVIASELHLDLYKIDLSQVVSKYIGETEKNLDLIFSAAENANVILFFDEADALFGKRSDVKDAHDRYANIEIGYLLQKMEEYEGIAILATNLRQNMDDAFVRRLHFIVEFPFPDEEYRQHIWEVTFPPEAPLGKELDLGFLARQVRLPGGNIKNISLAAAFYAARTEESIQMSHLIQATRREYQKLGRTWNEAEWNGYQIESGQEQ